MSLQTLRYSGREAIGERASFYTSIKLRKHNKSAVGPVKNIETRITSHSSIGIQWEQFQLCSPSEVRAVSMASEILRGYRDKELTTWLDQIPSGPAQLTVARGEDDQWMYKQDANPQYDHVLFHFMTKPVRGFMILRDNLMMQSINGDTLYLAGGTRLGHSS